MRWPFQIDSCVRFAREAVRIRAGGVHEGLLAVIPGDPHVPSL